MLTSGVTFFAAFVLMVVAIIYFVGGYFVDLGLRRGSAEDPSAPPAIFRSAFEGNGSALSPASMTFASVCRSSCRLNGLAT